MLLMYTKQNVIILPRSLPSGGGGVWSSVNCALVTSSTGQLQCRCLHAGTYAVLDVRVTVCFCILTIVSVRFS